MSTGRACAVLAGVVLAASGAVAAASGRRAHFSVNERVIKLAYALGTSYWHKNPCGGNVEFEWTSAARSRIATAYWTSRAGGGPDDYADCRVVLNRSAAFDWPKFCTVMVHELGHLTGHGHVRDRADVMYPFYVGPRGPCTRAQPTAPADAGTAPPAQAPAPNEPAQPIPSGPAPPPSPPGPAPSPPPPGPPPPAPQQPPPPQSPNPIAQLLGSI